MKMKENEVLTMRGINKTFPGVKALNGVDFTLRKGEIHALMGENGAGKSTLIKVLTGVYDFEAGEIRVDGIDGPVVNHSTQEAQEKGIATVYQEVNLCPNLTVAENLFIGREPRNALGLIQWKKMNKMAQKIVDDLLRLLWRSSRISCCSDSVGFSSSHSSMINRTGLAYFPCTFL